MCNRFWPVAFVLSLACPMAWAQTPAGPEFQVNSYTTGAQRAPKVASDATGNFVIVWHGSGQDGSFYGILGQRFNASGIPLGSEFQVNSYTTGNQSYPAVASAATGNFVVVWNGSGQDGSSYGVFGQRFSASGLPLGSEFQVNSYTTGLQATPRVASDASGNFVVVWQSYQDGSGSGVFGQRFNASGVPQGGEFQVNSYTTSYQVGQAVASDANGNFVVVWQSGFQDGSGDGVFGQRFNASGVPQGSEFQVNSYTTGSQRAPAVASGANGNFVVAWQGSYEDGSSAGIFGQRFGASGVPLGSEFQVNSYTTGDQLNPALASDSDGNFVVVWTSTGQDGSSDGVFGQGFNAAGPPMGSEFRANSFTAGSQQVPALASAANGSFVVVWNSASQDGSSYGVFGQRFGVDRLTVSKAGTGTGTVTSIPAGINCGTDCAETYSHGTSVILTAATDPTSTFAGWSGGGCSGTGTCTVSMTVATTVTATFTLITSPPPSFTDDPLQPRTTPVKMVHVTELRQAVNALRARTGLAAAIWTDATMTTGVTPAKAVHLTELRTALAAVYVAAGRTAPTYTHATITGGATVISAVDVAELRAAVLSIW